MYWVLGSVIYRSNKVQFRLKKPHGLHLFCGFLTNSFGRRLPMILLTIPMIVGWLLILFACGIYNQRVLFETTSTTTTSTTFANLTTDTVSSCSVNDRLAQPKVQSINALPSLKSDFLLTDTSLFSVYHFIKTFIGYSSFSFCMGEHSGTHIDAPFHFNADGWTVEKIPMSNLINVPAIVIDIAKYVNQSSKPYEATLNVNHIIEHEKLYGTIPLRAVVLVHTGWSNFWPNKRKYLGYAFSASKKPTLNYHGVSLEATKWLYEKRKVLGIGIDTVSLDMGTIEHFPSHVYLAENQSFILENVVNLSKLIDIGSQEKSHTIDRKRIKIHDSDESMSKAKKKSQLSPISENPPVIEKYFGFTPDERKLLRYTKSEEKRLSPELLSDDDDDDELPVRHSIGIQSTTIPRNSRSLESLHSSRMPQERLPLTKGLKVDSMVKRLSLDRFSPPLYFNSPLNSTV